MRCGAWRLRPKWRRLQLACLASGLLTVVPAAEAVGCSCRPAAADPNVRIESALANSSSVFSGIVVDTRLVDYWYLGSSERKGDSWAACMAQGDSDLLKCTTTVAIIEVQKSWKGVEAHRVELEIGDVCAFRFELGHRYLVFASPTQNDVHRPKLATSICTETTQLPLGTNEVPQLSDSFTDWEALRLESIEGQLHGDKGLRLEWGHEDKLVPETE